MKKIVISGGASCGKTSLINVLRTRGFRVLEETPSEVIEDRNDLMFDLNEKEKRKETYIISKGGFV